MRVLDFLSFLIYSNLRRFLRNAVDKQIRNSCILIDPYHHHLKIIRRRYLAPPSTLLRKEAENQCTSNVVFLQSYDTECYQVVIGIYGPLPLILPVFFLNGNPVKVSAQNTTWESPCNLLAEIYSRITTQ